MINSKSQLAILLSNLHTFDSPDPKSEQYPTDSETAAALLWNAHMLGDLNNKTIADFGCGTGILGIGALLLGAKHVTFIDTDKNTLLLLKSNLKEAGIKDSFIILNSDVTTTQITADVILQNPPFGTKQKHADRAFLEKAFHSAPTIYSFHKTNTVSFIKAISKDHNYIITHSWQYNFPLKGTMKFHKSRIKYIDVTCYRLERS